MQNNPQRETIIYKSGIRGYATPQYEKDLKKRLKEGWRLISCTESGRDMAGRVILTAIYERGDTQSTPQQQSALNVKNLELLLGMLNIEEKAQFENSVQQIVNQWLARKATGQ